jgi:hypothetical protein
MRKHCRVMPLQFVVGDFMPKLLELRTHLLLKLAQEQLDAPHTSARSTAAPKATGRQDY